MTFAATQDTFTFLKALDQLWATMSLETGKARLLMVSVHLSDLYEPQHMTLDLFEQAKAEPQTIQNQNLSRALDALNTRYGKQTITVGPVPQTSAGYMGTRKLPLIACPKEKSSGINQRRADNRLFVELLAGWQISPRFAPAPPPCPDA